MLGKQGSEPPSRSRRRAAVATPSRGDSESLFFGEGDAA